MPIKAFIVRVRNLMFFFWSVDHPEVADRRDRNYKVNPVLIHFDELPGIIGGLFSSIRQ